MPIIQFSKRDLLRSTVVVPAWYRCKIENVGEKLANDGGSTNYPVEATIIRNADNGDEKFKDVPLDWNFNSKALGFIAPFIEALGETPAENKRFELGEAKGAEIDIFVGNKVYNGRTLNDPGLGYRKPK